MSYWPKIDSVMKKDYSCFPTYKRPTKLNKQVKKQLQKIEKEVGMTHQKAY